MYNWEIRHEEANIELMSEVLKISKRLAQVMVNRGIRTRNTALKYLNPKIEAMHDPRLIKDMDKAIDILTESLIKNEKIVVFGDYDVDGVISVVILYKALKLLGADVTYYIPHREHEGYGLNMTAIKRMHEAQTDLIIACDNGIAALQEAEYIKENGIKLIIIDHHEPSFVTDSEGERQDVLPKADAVIDPKQQECTYPFKKLCAGALVYKFVKYLFQRLNKDFDTDEYLVFAMIATFCDIVDLQDENRIIAKNGLRVLNNNKSLNMGLNALIDAKSLSEKELTNFCIGFIIGPCINACGRLETAGLAVELFTTDNPEEAKELALRLCTLNDNRKLLTQHSTKSALEQLSSTGQCNDSVIVFYDPKMHESIIGIVAGRIKEQLSRPAIVFTQGETLVKGSARSVEGYNIYEELFKCRDLFERFGGHPMAAGISLKEENIEDLRQRLNSDIAATMDFTQTLYCESEMPLSEVTFDLARELTYLAPFGKANDEPLFLSRNLRLASIKVIENKSTIIFQFNVEDTKRQIKAVSFGMVEIFRERLEELYSEYETEKILCGILRNCDLLIDLVYSVQINTYNNDVSVQMMVKDFKLHRGN